MKLQEVIVGPSHRKMENQELLSISRSNAFFLLICRLQHYEFLIRCRISILVKWKNGMTAKVKAAAYRLTGGAKTVYSVDYEEKVSLFSNFKKQIEKLIGLVVTLITVSYYSWSVINFNADALLLVANNKFLFLSVCSYPEIQKYWLLKSNKICCLASYQFIELMVFILIG